MKPASGIAPAVMFYDHENATMVLADDPSNWVHFSALCKILHF